MLRNIWFLIYKNYSVSQDAIEFICNVLQRITNLSYSSLMVILKQRGRQRR